MCNSPRVTMRKGNSHQLFSGNDIRAKQRVAKAGCTERNRPKFKCQTSKAVRFHGTVEVSVKQVSREEVNQTWYGPLEYKHFQKDSKSSLKAVTSHLAGNLKAYDSRQHCLRGLEACISTQVYQQRKEQKLNIVNEVLNRQLLLRILGVRDPENLATLSKDLSQNAQHRALLLAALDSHGNTQSGNATSLR